MKQEDKDKIIEELRNKGAAGDVQPEDVDNAVKGRLLQNLRRAARYMPDGKKAKTKSVIGTVLSDSQLIELWARLCVAKKRGESAYDQLAFRVQKEWKHCTEMSQWHVSRAIMFYEQRIFGLLGVAESVPELEEWTQTKRDAVDKIVERVDGLEMLSNAIAIQMNRIEMAHGREKQMKNILPFVHQEMKALSTMIDTYLNYQIELGVHKRQPIPIDLTLKRGLDAQTREIEQKVGREPMLNAAHKFLDMIQSDDGKAFEVVTLKGAEDAKERGPTAEE